MEVSKKFKLALILSNLMLFVYLVFRLINQAKILKYFPLDTTNDISSHIAQLYFLKTCGFHNLCAYWYNGYSLLKFYPPGWFFFSYPLLLIFKRPEIAAYVSIILMLLISFIAIYKIIKLKEKSFLKSTSFFLFLFGTATSVSGFFRLGRVTELFGWMIFLILSYFILKYKDKSFDYNFIYFIPFYTIMLISQPIFTIPFHFFLLSLFLVKLRSKKELLILIVFTLLGIILSSFWWYPFVNSLGSESRTYSYLPEITQRFFDLTGQWVSSTILITILPIITLVMFYIYYLTNKDKKELLFYSPILLISLLVVTRIATIIPYLNFVYPEPYFTFFIIFILIFLFNLNFEKLPRILQNLIPLGIILVSILSISVSVLTTSYYQGHTQLEKTTLNLLNEAKGPFMILETPSSTSYPKAYYSYAAIYLNLSTPSGWSPSELTDERNDLLNKVGSTFHNKNCNDFTDVANKLNLKEIITYNEFCNLKEKCNFRERIIKDNTCLIRL